MATFEINRVSAGSVQVRSPEVARLRFTVTNATDEPASARLSLSFSPQEPARGVVLEEPLVRRVPGRGTETVFIEVRAAEMSASTFEVRLIAALSTDPDDDFTQSAAVAVTVTGGHVPVTRSIDAKILTTTLGGLWSLAGLVFTILIVASYGFDAIVDYPEDLTLRENRNALLPPRSFTAGVVLLLQGITGLAIGLAMLRRDRFATTEQDLRLLAIAATAIGGALALALLVTALAIHAGFTVVTDGLMFSLPVLAVGIALLVRQVRQGGTPT